MHDLCRRLHKVAALLREDQAQPAIVTDVDGTLVDISKRVIAAFARVGIRVTAETWEDALDDMDHAAKEQFYPHFYSDQLAKTDRPIKPAIVKVKQLADRTDLPVVVLTGRPDTMEHTHVVADLLRMAGVPVSRVIQRPATVHVKAAKFKPAALKEAGFWPRYALDDNEGVLAAFAQEWPEAELYRVNGTSVGRY